MCDVKGGHSYTEDAKVEAGMGESVKRAGPWERFVDASIRYLPTLLVLLGLWMIRVEMRIGPSGFSLQDAIVMESDLEAKMLPQLYKESVDGQFEDLRQHLIGISTQIRHTNDRIDILIINGGGE